MRNSVAKALGRIHPAFAVKHDRMCLLEIRFQLRGLNSVSRIPIMTSGRSESESGYADPTVLTPGWCTLSLLFSDWDRTGRGDLRITNDRHYYRDGEEQLWRVEEGKLPRRYTREEGWKRVEIWSISRT